MSLELKPALGMVFIEEPGQHAAPKIFEPAPVREVPPQIDVTPSIAPAGWQIDIERMQDEKIIPLAKAGYLPLQPKITGSPNRGITTWPQRFQNDFGRNEVVFLWKTDSNGRVHTNGNGHHEPSTPKVIPFLYSDIGRDINETSDNPRYVMSREWETNGHCKTDKDKRHMEMAVNYLLLLNELKQNGKMPQEWTWKYKTDYWEKNIKPLNNYDFQNDPYAEKGTPTIPGEEPVAIKMSPEELEILKAESELRQQQEFEAQREEQKIRHQKGVEARVTMLLDLAKYYLKQPSLTKEQKDEIAQALSARAVDISEEKI